MLRRTFIDMIVAWVAVSPIQQPDPQVHILTSGTVTGSDHEIKEGYFTIGPELQIMVPPASISADVLRGLWQRDKQVELIVRTKPEGIKR